MSQKISALKAQAQNLRVALERAGTPATLAFAQELLAQQYGLADWNTLVALADKKTPTAPAPVTKPPRLSDVPSIPDGVQVEIGSRTKLYTVEEFDEEVMLAIDDPVALAGVFAQPYRQDESETETTVIMGFGDGEDLYLTVADLQGAEGRILGGSAYWELADGRIISFVHGKGWAPEISEEPAAPDSTDVLVVPALMARSSRGCKVSPVKEGLAVLPANMSQDRFHELLGERLPSPLEASDAMVDGVCAQLGVQWLSPKELAQAGVSLASAPVPVADPRVIPEIGSVSLDTLRKLYGTGPQPLDLFVPVSKEHVIGDTANYLTVRTEICLKVTGLEDGLRDVQLYPAPDTLPTLADPKLTWVRVQARLNV